MTKPFPAYRGSDAYIFVCYAHEDAEIVYTDIALLHESGINVWYDEGISPGTNWRAEVGESLEGAEHVLLYISKPSLASEHCNREINYALDKNVHIVPVRLDATPLTVDLRLGLSRAQTIDRSEHTSETFHEILCGVLATSTATRDVVEAVPEIIAEAVPETFIEDQLETTAKSELDPRPQTVSLETPSLAEEPVKEIAADANDFSAERNTRNRSLAIAAAAVVFVIALVAVYMPYNAPVLEPQSEEKSIVVLPFVNMSGDLQQEYFSDSISEEILNVLTKTTNLKVISRTSAFSYKGKNSGVATYVAELGVTHILEGSVRKGGDEVRITAQLIDALTDTHLWSDTYTVTLDDVFAVQDQIAAAVVAQLRVRLLDNPVLVFTTDPETHRMYLQARHLIFQFTPQALQTALPLLQQAVERDPSYFPALKELTRAYMNSNQWQLAREVSMQVAEIGPNYAASLLGWIEMKYNNDMAVAARYVEQSLVHFPTDVDVLRGAVGVVINLRRPEDAIRLGEYLLEHDPICMTCLKNLGDAYVGAGLLDEAETIFRQLLRQGRVAGYSALAQVRLLKGDAGEALSLYKQALRPQLGARGVLLSLYAMGEFDEYNAGLVEFEANYSQVWPLGMATIHAHAGDKDEAFRWLEQHQKIEHNPNFGGYTHSLLQGLHSDPRWQQFLESQGVSDAQLAVIDFKPTFPN